MSDHLLSETDVESALSIAYVQAVAAHAGFTCGEPPGPDRDSIDLQIAAGGQMRPKLDLQLKATIGLRASAAGFSYAVSIKNYNDLRVKTQTPRLLIVLDLPSERDEWINVSEDSVVMKRAAYWLSLAGMNETTNTTSVTLSIPKANIFDVVTLKRLMELSRTGGPLT